MNNETLPTCQIGKYLNEYYKTTDNILSMDYLNCCYDVRVIVTGEII